MSSAANKLAIAYGTVNRPPVRFLFVGSTTAAYFFGCYRNRLGFESHIVSLIALVDSAVMTTGEQADLRALATNLVWPELLPAAWRGASTSSLPSVPQPPQPTRTQDEANEAHTDSGSDGDAYYET